jgi:hypothetical protein
VKPHSAHRFDVYAEPTCCTRTLVKDSDAVFDYVDEFLCCGTDPVEAVANDLGVVRLPGCEVERRPGGVEPAVAPDDVRDRFGLDFAFRPLGVVLASK